MDEHSELRTMIEEGKDRLEWYRQVDPAKLNTLKELMTGDDYKENMSTLIKTIYEFAFLTYSGKNYDALSSPRLSLTVDVFRQIFQEDPSRITA